MTVMIQKRLPLFLAAAILCAPVLAENPAIKPIPDDELLKQVEALHPVPKDAAPAPNSPRFSINAAAPTTLSAGPTQVQLNGAPGATDSSANGNRPGIDRSSILAPGATGPENKPALGPDGQPLQQPTEITAMEATFNQKANIAVFLINVFVKDPQFNLTCDKLTAYLKEEDATPAAPGTKPGAKGAATPAKGAATPKAAAATPTPATPAAKPGATPHTGPTAIGTPAPVKKKSGLDKAIAVTTSERRVIITQDKVEADGTITHSIGLSNRAEYFADTGDVFLYGMPDVTQATNRCIATAPETWMKLMRDGRMEAHGPHKTIIIDSDRQNGNNNAKTGSSSTPAPSTTSTAQ